MAAVMPRGKNGAAGGRLSAATPGRHNVAHRPMESRMRPETVLLVFSTAPDLELARKIAQHLVEHRLAACVNVLAPCQSIYSWEGGVEDATEIPLLIKTTAARYGMLEEAIHSLHPYEVPEIVALPVSHGLPAYLGWVDRELARDS